MSHKLKEKRCTIALTARLLKVGRATIHRWIKVGAIPPPIAENIGGMKIRYWTSEGFAKVCDYRKNDYRTGQGRRTDLGKKRTKKNNKMKK